MTQKYGCIYKILIPNVACSLDGMLGGKVSLKSISATSCAELLPCIISRSLYLSFLTDSDKDENATKSLDLSGSIPTEMPPIISRTGNGIPRRILVVLKLDIW